MKEPYHDHQPLGDIDGSGTYLLDVLVNYLANLGDVRDPGGERELHCLGTDVNGEELSMILQHGQSGVAADIVDANQQQQYRQVHTDTSLVRCGGLFRLPRQGDTGWLALHVNNGRGIKGLLDLALPPLLRTQFNRMLELKPFVRGDALREAVRDNKLAKVRLLRYDQPSDRASASTGRWVRAGEFGKIELDISVKGRGHMLKAGPLRQWLGNPRENTDIFEFNGIQFDQAKVEVEVGDGRRRTFNLQNPDAGHPMTITIEPDLDREGEPEEASLIAELGDAIDDAGG